MTEGDGGRVVTEGPPEGAHHLREQTEGGAGRGATKDPPDGVQDLEKISKVIVKGINILPEGERERGPPFTNLRKDWSRIIPGLKIVRIRKKLKGRQKSKKRARKPGWKKRKNQEAGR